MHNAKGTHSFSHIPAHERTPTKQPGFKSNKTHSQPSPPPQPSRPPPYPSPKPQAHTPPAPPIPSDTHHTNSSQSPAQPAKIVLHPKHLESHFRAFQQL